MQAAPARYVSVSELYSTDEVELLLDEIRELEPTSCRGEDVQDFEIAGSGFGVGPAGAGGGRSPAGTELTERSWDSHAHYSRAPPPAPRAVAPVYCRLAHLATLSGAFTLVIVLCSSASVCCVWGVAGLRAWLLPLASRVRLLQLGALTSTMLHTTLLLMHVTRLAAILPLDWDKLGMWTCVWSCGSLWAGGALMLHAVLAAPEYRWTPPPIAGLLLAAAALALCGGSAACVVALRVARACWAAHKRGSPRPPSLRSEGSLRAAYRAVPSAPPPAPVPSTSRQAPDDPL